MDLADGSASSSSVGPRQGDARSRLSVIRPPARAQYGRAVEPVSWALEPRDLAIE